MRGRDAPPTGVGVNFYLEMVLHTLDLLDLAIQQERSGIGRAVGFSEYDGLLLKVA